jgi:hypothetical protein
VKRTAVWCAAVVAIAACGSAPPAPRLPPPAPVPATVEIAAGECPAAATAEAQIRAVLATHRADYADLVIRVDAAPAATPPAQDLKLAIVRSTGELGVERSYTLGPADCASAAELVALAVDRFLTSFPEWAGPAPPPPPPPPPATRWTEVALAPAINSMWIPIGLDGQLGGIVDHGGARDRFGGSVVVRAGIPQSAGNGRFQQTMLLAGIAWRHRDGPWRLRVEARAGAVRITGFGFTENNFDWLPWWEGAVFGGRALSWGTLGVELSATALRHKAVTGDGLVSEDVPLLRIGLSGEFGLVSGK